MPATRARAAPAPPSALPPRRDLPGVPGFELSRVEIDRELDLTVWSVPELGNSSYLLSLPGARTVVAIDPVRDVGGYLAYLQKGGAGSPQRFLALDTHIHADFVAGSRALATRAGAEMAIGSKAELSYPHRGLGPGEVLDLGGWSLKVLPTPGHTPEHVSYLLRDPRGRPSALFSGGALMLGGAARTDLLGISLARPLARELYRSLHEQIAPLPGSVALLPTHGGGSFCGATCSDRKTSTLQEERQTNPLLRAPDEETFMARLFQQGPYPLYFLRMRDLNSHARETPGGELPELRALSLERFDRARAEGAVVVDTREEALFDRGHIPGSYSVGAEGPLSAWIGWLMPPERRFVFLSQGEMEAQEAARQLYRIGFDGAVGYLAGGFAAWKEAGRAVASHPGVTVSELAARLGSGVPSIVLDVREAHEWFDGHIPGSLNIPVASLPERAKELPRDVPLYVHCAHGYRASIASSLLEQAGFEKVSRVVGGYEDWVNRPPVKAARMRGAPPAP